MLGLDNFSTWKPDNENHLFPFCIVPFNVSISASGTLCSQHTGTSSSGLACTMWQALCFYIFAGFYLFGISMVCWLLIGLFFFMGNCRYVGNIHPQVTDPLLQEVFSNTGLIEGCKLIRKDKVRLYCFISFWHNLLSSNICPKRF